MFNAEVPVRTFTLWSREIWISEWFEGYLQGIKIKEEHFDNLDEIIIKISNHSGYTVVDPFYSVSHTHGHRVKRVERKHNWRQPYTYNEKEEYATFVIEDNWGKRILKEELREYASYMPPITYRRSSRNGKYHDYGWKTRKGGGHRAGYGSINIKDRRRADSSLDQDYYLKDPHGCHCEECEFYFNFPDDEDSVNIFKDRFKTRKNSDNFSHYWWGDRKKGQSTNWKHKRKTQYKQK